MTGREALSDDPEVDEYQGDGEPYKDLPVEAGVGYQDPEATELDTDEPDIGGEQ